jgi:hypothetical protein
MKATNLFRQSALVLGVLFSLTLGAAAAVDQPSVTSRADKPAAVPVAATFAKAEGDKGPYVLTLKSTSATTLKVNVVVAESIKSHAKPGQRKNDYTIEAGKSATVEALAAHDKVTVSAEGFAPLELTVP